MTEFPRRDVEYHLAGLDRERLGAFVADLWEARGYETHRDGDSVVADHASGAVSIWVESGTGHPDARTGDDGVDVVVAPDGEATSGAGRTVDAATLSEMLAYGVNREVATALCERHLGGPPDELPSPPLTRLERRARAVGAMASPVLLASVFLLVVLGGFAVGFAPLTGPAPGPSTATTDGLTPTAAATGGVVTSAADRSPDEFAVRVAEGPANSTVYPPGVTPRGIVDTETLALAHERAVSGRSYTLWVDRYRPRRLEPGGTRVQRDIDIAVEGDRYRIVTTEVVGENRTRLGALYHDGTVSFAAPYNETTGRYGRTFRLDPRQSIQPTPETVRERLVRGYLSTPRTNLTGPVSESGRPTYRIVGSGQPNVPALDGVRNYSVVALVEPDGFVRQVTVEYEETGAGGSYGVRREVTYDRRGTTTVEPPTWFDYPGDDSGST